MPELPDITVYIEALEKRILGQNLERIRLANPFVLRSVAPSIREAEQTQVVGLHRIGKRIVMELEGELFIVIHLMIAGRLRWKAPGAKFPGKISHAAFDFPTGTLLFTEAGTKKRASLHLVRGRESLASVDPGGIDVMTSDLPAFLAKLRLENHTLKRSLTDPRLFSGIGNAYSDEILHRAGLSPLKLSASVSEEDVGRLLNATRAILSEWTDRLRKETGGRFPEKVTAFHEEMAVHGRYNKPCPVCGTKVQRIVYAQNECNYCPRCQTEGKLLADRAFSRLLKDDWPKNIDELEERFAKQPSSA